MLASVKAKYVVLEPTHPSEAPPNSIFVDSTNGNQMTVKGNGGGASPIGGGADSIFIKKMVAGAAIPANVPVSKRSDGKIIEADSDGVQAQNFVGYSQEAASEDGQHINVMLAGANLAGAVMGLGFTVGQDVFLSEIGGYTNDPNSFTGGDDSLIRVGIADCAGAEASSVATDLISFSTVLARP